MRKFLISTALGAMLIAGGVAVAVAQPAADGPAARILPGDTNKDGKLTKAELTAALDARFAKMDLNGDGRVTPDERAALREKRLEARFARIDTDGNGQVSKAEFMAAHAGRGKGPDAGEADGDPAKRPHGMMRGRGMGMSMGMGRDEDRDGGRGGDRDGTLTREEFMARPLAMFDRMDANKDGVATADEAKAAWQARGEGPGRGWGKRGHGGGDMPSPPPAQ